MKELELIITVSTTGETELEVLNGDGKNCTNFSQGFEDALGKIKNRNFKKEARTNHEQTTKRQNINQAHS